jgi:hypothetical protein
MILGVHIQGSVAGLRRVGHGCSACLHPFLSRLKSRMLFGIICDTINLCRLDYPTDSQLSTSSKLQATHPMTVTTHLSTIIILLRLLAYTVALPLYLALAP